MKTHMNKEMLKKYYNEGMLSMQEAMKVAKDNNYILTFRIRGTLGFNSQPNYLDSVLDKYA